MNTEPDATIDVRIEPAWTVRRGGADDLKVFPASEDPANKDLAIVYGRALAVQYGVRCWIREDEQWREIEPL